MKGNPGFAPTRLLGEERGDQDHTKTALRSTKITLKGPKAALKGSKTAPRGRKATLPQEAHRETDGIPRPFE